MNLNNDQNNVNRFEQFQKEYAISCYLSHQAETNIYKFPENSDLLLELRDAQAYKKSVSETQDLLLQEITKSDIDRVDELYWRDENGDEDFYVDEEFYYKMDLVSMALLDGKYPPNVDVNSMDTEVVENGITTIHEFPEKFLCLDEIWLKQKREQREKEFEEVTNKCAGIRRESIAG